MQKAEQAYQCAVDLYWIAFLLTGRPELSVDATLAALESDDGGELFSWPAIPVRLRSKVVAKALAGVREELALSARQTALRPPAAMCKPLQRWSLDPTTSTHQIESALLGIEIFPRCALLLTVFEGMSPESASALLNSERDLILKGQRLALPELTQHLAQMQGWNSGDDQLRELRSAAQHGFKESHSTPLSSEARRSI